MRQAAGRLSYVDGTLVFGVPVLTFGMQYLLARDWAYGPAFSALGFGLYLLMAFALLRHGGRGRRGRLAGLQWRWRHAAIYPAAPAGITGPAGAGKRGAAVSRAWRRGCRRPVGASDQAWRRHAGGCGCAGRRRRHHDGARGDHRHQPVTPGPCSGAPHAAPGNHCLPGRRGAVSIIHFGNQRRPAALGNATDRRPAGASGA